MSTLTIINDNKLGSRPVLYKSNVERVPLNYPSRNKRIFTEEGHTIIPDLDTKPSLVSNGHASSENGWTNNYNDSSRMTTKEGTVNSVFGADSYSY